MYEFYLGLLLSNTDVDADADMISTVDLAYQLDNHNYAPHNGLSSSPLIVVFVHKK